MHIELLQRFLAVQDRLEDAISRDDQELLAGCDAEIVQIWNDILIYKPRNVEERIVLATFLIEQIQPNRHSATIISQIRMKLLDLL